MKGDYEMNSFSQITPYIKKMAEISKENNNIKPEMYKQYNVNKGLRDSEGKGVVTGLTEISFIKSKEILEDGTVVPCHGQLSYRGLDINSLVDGFLKDDRFGFEETIYLLLFSRLPNKQELEEFKKVLVQYRSLPQSFTRDMILKAPGQDMMNIISRCVLALYSYDDNPDDISIENVLRQSLQLISILPMIAVYSYHSYMHYHKGESLFIHLPDPNLSLAENFLRMLRKDGKYTHLEASILDLTLVLHAEHGGGNNSSFTTHVVTSSGTDTYSTIAAALGSLKGPRHGGANIKVVKMFEDMHNSIDTTNEDEIRNYLERLLDKEAFDKTGLIYGFGHAVYSISDPRAEILKRCVKELSHSKGYDEEYKLYKTVARIAPELIAKKCKIFKGVSANVDFYSGLIYKILDLPLELYTPIFAIARVAGWSAHRIEEIQNAGKIIRPAYIGVKTPQEYKNLDER